MDRGSGGGARTRGGGDGVAFMGISWRKETAAANPEKSAVETGCSWPRAVGSLKGGVVHLRVTLTHLRNHRVDGGDGAAPEPPRRGERIGIRKRESRELGRYYCALGPTYVFLSV
jgi:hypothetical protein